MKDVEYVKCPVCQGNPRRWLSHDECMANCIHSGSYEDCPNCEDGYVVSSSKTNPSDSEIEDANREMLGDEADFFEAAGINNIGHR